MAYNNTVILTGNTGGEVRIIETEQKPFASFSLATKDSYKDSEGNWVEKESVWHDVIAFNPVLVELLKSYKKGVRLKITGELSYRPIKVQLDDGSSVTKKQASIIVRKVEPAPLVQKTPGQVSDAS